RPRPGRRPFAARRPGHVGGGGRRRGEEDRRDDGARQRGDVAPLHPVGPALPGQRRREGGALSPTPPDIFVTVAPGSAGPQKGDRRGPLTRPSQNFVTGPADAL